MAKSKKHYIASDFKANPELKEKMGGLRGAIVGMAETKELPDRFQVTPDEAKPRVWITDTQTGKQAKVPLFAYAPVREVLNALFGES